MGLLTPSTVTVGEQVRTLDWTLRLDPASLPYKVSVALPNLMGRRPRNRSWSKGIWLDQGSEGACVGFSAGHILATTPKVATNVGHGEATLLYREAQKRDQWAGENYEGSSVLGSMAHMKEIGLLNAYYWCTTLEELQAAVAYYGPVHIGVDWYSGMFRPDADGFLRILGRLAGGHAVEVAGVSYKRQAFWIENSWGKDWGLNGGAWISFADMARLINDGGEFALPRKIKGGTLDYRLAA